MSFGNVNHHTVTLPAAADLSSSQFLAVKVNSSGQAAVASTGEFCAGILQNKPGSGQAATVAYGGISKVVAGGNVTAGMTLAANSSGKLVNAAEAVVNTSDAGGATDAVIASNVVGIALASGVANDVIPMLVLMAGATPTTAA
jgi:hypothetical protein